MIHDSNQKRTVHSTCHTVGRHSVEPCCHPVAKCKHDNVRWKHANFRGGRDSNVPVSDSFPLRGKIRAPQSGFPSPASGGPNREFRSTNSSVASPRSERNPVASLVSLLMCLLAYFLGAAQIQAQWLTQTFELKAGWNAIFTHVDLSHAALEDTVGADANNPIQEVWLWQPSITTAQFVKNPQEPIDTGTQWGYWKRGETGNTLQRLVGNQAFLVRVDDAVPTFSWDVVGKPVTFSFRWTTTGLNFVGFPTAPSSPPTYEAFLNKAPELQQTAEVYQYVGGDLGLANPAPLFAFRTTPVQRGEAVWIRSGDVFNRFYGPFELNSQSRSGVGFGSSLSQHRVRLRNLVAEPLTVSAELISSETPPAGETPIAGTPPLLLRGDLDTATLTYGHSDFATGTQNWTLQPKGEIGSEVEIVIGVDRFRMQGNAGDLFAGIIRFTDSLGFSQMDVPVSATVASTTGLWIGEALVNQVRHQLVAYERDADGNLVQDAEGGYVPETFDESIGDVSRAVSLRLIVHNNDASEAVLLQRVFHGLDSNSDLILANKESALDPNQLEAARRMSSVHLPWTEANNPWPFIGELKQGQTLATVVTVGHDDHTSNPFLHTYHPDHDNLNATFTQNLPQGFESFGVIRQITLLITPPPDDFGSRTSGNLTFSGTYTESILLSGTGSEFQEYQVQGAFALNRVSEIATLTIQ